MCSTMSEMCKKRKLDSENAFAGFKLQKILNTNPSQKSITLLGKFHEEGENGIVIFERKVFNEKLIQSFLENCTTEETLLNDIYSTYALTPDIQNEVKATMIFPSTESHVIKYSKQEVFFVEETEEDYKKITLPHIESKQFGLDWVYNILEKKRESERIIYEDPDPEMGFVILPDFKWDLQQKSQLYVIGIVQCRDIHSIRDLRSKHVPLLNNVLHKGKTAILEKYDVPGNKLRIYFHYQPSYYHLHIHFTHLEFNLPGINVERAHLLTDVIDNIEMKPDYYEKKTFHFSLRETDPLYLKFQSGKK